MSFPAAATATNISARIKAAKEFVKKVKQESAAKKEEADMKEETEVEEETKVKEETEVKEEEADLARKVEDIASALADLHELVRGGEPRPAPVQCPVSEKGNAPCTTGLFQYDGDCLEEDEQAVREGGPHHREEEEI